MAQARGRVSRDQKRKAKLQKRAQKQRVRRRAHTTVAHDPADKRYVWLKHRYLLTTDSPRMPAGSWEEQAALNQLRRTIITEDLEDSGIDPEEAGEAWEAWLDAEAHGPDGVRLEQGMDGAWAFVHVRWPETFVDVVAKTAIRIEQPSTAGTDTEARRVLTRFMRLIWNVLSNPSASLVAHMLRESLGEALARQTVEAPGGAPAAPTLLASSPVVSQGWLFRLLQPGTGRYSMMGVIVPEGRADTDGDWLFMQEIEQAMGLPAHAHRDVNPGPPITVEWTWTEEELAASGEGAEE